MLEMTTAISRWRMPYGPTDKHELLCFFVALGHGDGTLSKPAGYQSHAQVLVKQT